MSQVCHQANFYFEFQAEFEFERDGLKVVDLNPTLAPEKPNTGRIKQDSGGKFLCLLMHRAVLNKMACIFEKRT